VVLHLVPSFLATPYWTVCLLEKSLLAYFDEASMMKKGLMTLAPDILWSYHWCHDIQNGTLGISASGACVLKLITVVIYIFS
jgi:hypothetical protein